MIKVKTDDGFVWVNPNQIVYMAEQTEDGVSWIEILLTTEQVFEVDGPIEDILNQVKGLDR